MASLYGTCGLMVSSLRGQTQLMNEIPAYNKRERITLSLFAPIRAGHTRTHTHTHTQRFSVCPDLFVPSEWIAPPKETNTVAPYSDCTDVAPATLPPSYKFWINCCVQRIIKPDDSLLATTHGQLICGTCSLLSSLRGQTEVMIVNSAYIKVGSTHGSLWRVVV
jgi:hypothetical protein